MLLGAHVSTAGGLALAAERGRAIGADVVQVFTRNQVQWKARPVDAGEATAFRQAVARAGLVSVVAHAAYLINLASPDPEQLARSRAALIADLERCHALGIRCLIVHPGAHMGAGEAAGLAAVATSLDRVLERAQGVDVTLALEVTAGQGSCVGHRFEQLAEILARTRIPERVGVCLDTCHLLAAGYDIATPRGYAGTLAAFGRILGFERLRAVHLNDARQPLGSRLDRHAAIGRGHLGLAAFRRIVDDPRFERVPMVLETPSGMEGWRREIALLRRLRTRARAGGALPRRPRRGPTAPSSRARR